MTELTTKGKTLLEKLKQVVSQADINSKQAIQTASHGVEQTIEVLHSRKKKLEDAFKERNKLLEQSVKSCRLDEEIKEHTKWLHSDGELFLSQTESALCMSTEDADQLMKKHHQFSTTFKEKQETVQKVLRDGQKLVNGQHFDSATIKYKIGKLDKIFTEFSKKMDQQGNLLNQTVKFMCSSVTVLKTLETIRTKFQPPIKMSESEKMKHRKAASEAASTLLRDGRMLTSKTKCKRTMDVLKCIKDKHYVILTLTEKIINSDDEDVIFVSREIERISNWIINVAEDFLNDRKSPSSIKLHADDFEKDHLDIAEELNQVTKQINEVRAKVSGFSKKKKKLVFDFMERLDTLLDRCSTLSSRIKFRLLLVKEMTDFMAHTNSILKTVSMLQEELTSDEPHENINATTTTLNRQKQEKEQMVNSAEIYQEKGTRVLDDIDLCPEETAMDRRGLKSTILEDMMNIAKQVAQLEALWDQREDQLDRNKRLSTQFFEFEKEIRKVIGLMHDQSETFFPLHGEFPGLKSTHAELQERLVQLRNVAQLANKEISGHLEIAEHFASTSEQEHRESHTVTLQLQLVHQKFRTKISKYEALLSMCSTFYTSVEKLVSYMNRALQEYTSDFLPRATVYAVQRIKDHADRYQEIEELFTYTIRNGHDVLQAINEYESIDGKSTKIEEALNASASNAKAGGKESNLKELWEENKKNLDESVLVLQVLQRISQLTLDVEEQTRHLLKINSQFGNTLLSAVTFCQQSDTFQDEIKNTEQHINETRTSITKLIQTGHPDGFQLEVKLNLLERRCEKLAELTEDHKSLLNSAVEFYQLCEQVETWLKDSNQFVKTTRAGARRCTNEKEIRELVDLVDNFKASGREVQENRLKTLLEMSSLLNSEDTKARASHLKQSQDKVNERLERLRADMELQIQRIQSDLNVPLLWDNDDDTEDPVPEKRITLSNAANDTNILSDLSIHGEETMKWKDDLSAAEQASGRPKLLVSVSSNSQVPADMQKRISPIVKTEMNEFSKKDVAKATCGQPTTFTFGGGKTNGLTKLSSIGVSSSSSSLDTVGITNGGAFLGPQVMKEISVKTDYDIETSPPSPSPDDGGLMYTMKKTLVTTTKEVTTTTRQEIKTQLEVVHVDNESELPRRLSVATREADRVGVSVTTVSGVATTPSATGGPNGRSGDDDIADTLKKELQGTNENICRGVESSLFAERQDLLDDSYYAASQGNVPSIQGGAARSAKDRQRYEVYARDSNNKNLKIRHISKSNTITTTLPIKSDDRPVSMLELTLNLNDIDFEGAGEDQPQPPPAIVEEVYQRESMEGRNLESVPSIEDKDGQQRQAPMTVVLAMNEDGAENADNGDARQRKLERTLSDSSYTEGLANNILKESVEKLDPMVFVNKINEESRVFLSVLNCSIRNYMDKITVAPLKLQKNKDAIFRNVKDILHFQKTILTPSIGKCKSSDDIANSIIDNCEKMTKLFQIYISKASDLDRILTSTSYFTECNEHKGNLQIHLDGPQRYVANLITILQDCILQMVMMNKDSARLQVALRLLLNIKDLEGHNPKEIVRSLEDTHFPKEEVEEMITPQTNGTTMEAPPQERDPLDDYDIISSDLSSSASGKTNGYSHSDGVTIEIKTPEFNVLKEQPRYVISKGYTAKRKDEVHLPLGTEVTVIQKKNDRSYVVAFTKQNTELDRGWLPSYCLTLKTEATDINSKEAKPPVFTSQLISTSIVEGNPAELSVRLEGFPKPEVTWYLDGLPVRNDISHRVVWNGDQVMLKIAPAVIDDEGVYTVKAVNALGSATCQAEFIVESDVSSMSGLSDIEWEESKPREKPSEKLFMIGDNITFKASIDSNTPPSFIQRLKSKEVTLNSNVTFEIQAGGDPEPTVVWFLNDYKLESSKRVAISHQRTVHTIAFQRITEQDLGTLKCVLTNLAGKDECSCNISRESIPDDLNNNQSIPTLFAKSNNLQVISDTDAEFVVEFSGSPEPEIDWFKEQIHMTEDYGAEIKRESNKCSMILKEVTSDDEGLYTCVAKNVFGEVSCTFSLNVLKISANEGPRPVSLVITDEGPPVILEKFIDKQCYEGDTARFQVKAKGVPKPTVSWFFNDRQITMSKGNFELSQDGSNHILTIRVCEKEFGGRYRCIAENSHGKAVAEDDIVIHESIFPPKFLQQPKNLTVSANSTCTVSSVIRGKPKPNVEWYKDNRCLDERGGFQFINADDTYSLVIQRFTEKHAGIYKCSAFNSAGESSSVTQISLMKEKCSPQFTDQATSSNFKFGVGQTAKLEFNIQAHPTPKITWLKDGKALVESDDKISFKENPNTSTYTIFIKNAQYEDGGIYKCVAENSLGKDSCDCFLSIEDPLKAPRYTKGLSDSSVLEHEKDVELRVTVEGNPKPDVLFYKDGTILESSSRRQLVRDGNHHILHWKYILLDDNGDYSVVASNSEGEQISSCSLTVVTEGQKPEILLHEPSVSVNEFEPVTMKIKVTGIPMPQINWSKGNSLIHDNNNVTISNSVGSSSLTIESASTEDAGDYEAVAQNSSGTTKSQVRLAVTEAKKEFIPEFSSNLNDVKVSPGEEAVLEVGIAGYPVPMIQWKKDGKLLDECANIVSTYQNGVCKLTLKNCQKDSAGCIECVASNTLGEAVCQCFVIVQKDASSKDIKRSESEKSKAPKFLQPLRDLHIYLSEPIVLETVVAGTPFPDVRWYKQDKLLHPSKRIKIGSNSKDGKSYLRIVNAGKDDAGEYEIVSKNKHGETSMSCEVYMKDLIKVSREGSKRETKKPMKPVISDKPDEPHVYEGDEIKFSFTADGYPQPTIEILKNGKSYKQPSHVVTQFTDNVFTFFTNDAKTTDEAMYEFVVSNQHGEDRLKFEILVDDTGELEVVAKTIGSESRKQSKEESNRRSYSSDDENELGRRSRARISPKPPSKRGKKPKRFVQRDSGGDESDTDGLDEGTVSEDVVRSVVEETVEASSVPIFEEEAALEDTAARSGEPSFVEEPQHQKVTEGRPLKLVAKYTGSPEPAVKWFKEGKQLEEGDGITMETKNGQTVLKVNKCKEKDAGEYVCWLENKISKTMVPVMVEVALLPARPEFTTKLEDQVVTEGEDATYEVTITGLPYPDIQWFQDNRLLSQSDHIGIRADKDAKRHTLTIKNCTLREGRNLKCIARNIQGTATTMASLKVQETVIAPQFTISLQDPCEFMETEEIKLKVGFTGKPKPLVEWSINDQVVKSSPGIKIRNDRESSQLSISNCKEEHTGKYKAVCSNTAGEDFTECQLKVTEELRKPCITNTPKSVKTVEGKSASFKITFSGKPQPEVKWLHNGSEVQVKDGLEIKDEANKSSLVIKSCCFEHAGNYSCEVSNKAGTATCNVDLSVEESQSKPIILEKFSDTSLKENGSLELSVDYKGKPKPTVTWLKNEIKLKQDKRFSFIEEEGKATLRLVNATKNDTGNYKVLLKNSQGDTYCKAKVSVEENVEAPSFKDSLSDTEACEGEPLVLSVVCEGIPKPKLSWNFNGSAITAKSKAKISSSGEELRIEKSSLEDAGLYQCVATNKVGNETVSCTLSIQNAPKAPVVSERPENEVFSLFENDSFVENFTIDAHPKPDFEVTKNGEVPSTPLIIDFDEGTGKGLIEIPNVSAEDAGLYKIKVSNDHGSTELTFNISIKGVDDLMFTQKLNDLTTMEDGNAILEVMFKGHVVDVDWYKDNEYIDESDKFEIIDEEDRCTCVVHNCVVDDAGTYRCEILNENNSESCSAVVTVKEGVAMPAFLETLKDEVIEEGKKIVMKVVSEGKPEPAVKWLKDGAQLLNSVNVKIHSENRVHTLQIPSATHRDAGFYMCRLSNSVGVVECKVKVEITENATPPTITEPFEPETKLDAGSDAVLNFTYEGVKVKPAFFKDGKELKTDKRISILPLGKNTQQLTLKNVNEKDAGTYSAQATNQNGTAKTETTLQVVPKAKAPKFLDSKFTDTKLSEGDDLLLKMKIEGVPTPDVSFFKDDQLLADDKNYEIVQDDENVVLKKSDVTIEDSGVYACEITNDLGTQKCQTRIDVDCKPIAVEFTEKLRGEISLQQGEELVLRVQAKGFPQPELRWKKDGKPVASNVDTTVSEDGIVKSVVSIENALPKHAGKYMCIAKNDVGESKQTATVVINEIVHPPTFEHELKDRTAFEGDEIVLSTECSGSMPQHQKWSRDGKAIHNTSSTRVIRTDNMDHKFMLKIPKAKRSDSGKYELEVSNEAGKCITSCSLDIQESPIMPQFILKLKDHNNLVEGKSFECTTKASGKPAPDYHWFLNGKELVSNDDSITIIDREDGKSSLTIKSLDTQQHSGVLRCDAVNVAGTVSSDCNLKIKDAATLPEFTRQLDDMSCVEGQEMVLHARVAGKPTPEVFWLKSRKPVVESDNLKILQEGENYKLIIPKVTSSDAGRYKITASNKVGERFSSASVIIQERVEPPVFVESIPEKVFVVEGQMLALQCEYSGSPKPRIKWKYNGRNLKFDKRFQIIEVSDTCTRVEKMDFTSECAGTYICTLTNDSGEVSCECAVDIQSDNVVEPTFKSPLKDAKLQEGDNLVLEVVTEGVPEPEVNFYKDDMVLQNIDGIYIEHEANKWKVTIEDVEAIDSGRYTCKSSNSAGEKICVCSVVVAGGKGKASLLEPVGGDTAKTCKRGDNVVFEVQRPSENAPFVEWVFGETLLDPSDKYEIVEEDDGYVALIVHDVCTEDEGEYLCIGDLKEENDEEEVLFTLKVIPSDAKTAADEDVIKPQSEKQTESYPDEDVIVIEEEPSLESAPPEKPALPEKPAPPEVKKKKPVAPPPVAAKKTKTLVKEPSAATLTRPKISMRPKDKDVTSGSEARFTCNASGNPEPEIEWFFEDVLLLDSAKHMVTATDGSSTLVITGVSTNDIGDYKVVAKNEKGANATPFSLSVDGAKVRPQVEEEIATVLEEMLSETIPDSEEAFDDTDGGKGPVSVSIEFQGGDASDKVPSNGVSKGKNKKSSPVTVSMLVDTKPDSKPSLLTPMESVTAVEGEDVVLKAQFDGTPPLEFTWFKDELALIESPRVAEEIREGRWAILKITKARIEDEAEYVCIAANEFGGCETSAELLVDEQENPIQEELDLMSIQEIPIEQTAPEVKPKPGKKKAPVPPPPTAKKPKIASPQPSTKVEPPRFVSELKDVETCIGETLELSVETNSKKTQFNATWLLDGQILVEEEGLEVITEPPRYTLKMSGLIRDDEGEYTVELEHGNDKLSSTCTVLVNEEDLEAPEVGGDLESLEVASGETAELRALIYCTKPSDVSWFFNETKIEASDNNYEMGAEGEEYYLLVHDCSASDIGEYRLDVQNSSGKATTDCLLDVLPAEAPPVVMVIPECKGIMELYDGEELRLEFDFESDSNVSVEWMKNGKKVNPLDNWEIFADDLLAYLVIQNVGTKDSGKYNATVTNSAGKVEVPFEVQIASKFNDRSFFYLINYDSNL